MAMARSCPGGCEFAIIDKTGLLQAEDDSLSNIVFDAAIFKVSEKLALTFRSRDKCVERNCASYFVRVGALTTIYLCKLQRN